MIVPPDDVTLEIPHSAALSGDKLRYCYENQNWSRKEGRFVTDPYVSTFDGRLCQMFHSPGLEPFPTGFIRADDHHIDTNCYQLMPILMALRPVHPKLRPNDTSRLLNTGRTNVINGNPCVELTIPNPTSRSFQTLWIDPAKDHSLMRYESRSQEKVRLRVDISYTQDGVYWVPQKWNIVLLNADGAMRESFSARVESYQLNYGIPDSEFYVEFPIGTKVEDQSTSPATSYIVMGSNEKRMIRRDELALPYEELVRTGEITRGKAASVLGPAVAGLLVMVLAFLVLSAKYKRGRSMT
jgi:hypothetical protein